LEHPPGCIEMLLGIGSRNSIDRRNTEVVGISRQGEDGEQDDQILLDQSGGTHQSPKLAKVVGAGRQLSGLLDMKCLESLLGGLLSVPGCSVPLTALQHQFGTMETSFGLAPPGRGILSHGWEEQYTGRLNG